MDKPEDGARQLIVERADGIATITFSRPERRNALSLEMMRLFDNALSELAQDRQVAVVIITGAGDEAFGAGLDIKEAAGLSKAEHAEQHRLYESFQNRLAGFPKPLIAAVEGVAAGASFQIALHCDLVIVADGARIGMPELAAGRPCIIGSYLLSSRLGPGLAARLALGQDWLDAQGAATCGLAARVTETGRALALAQEYAERLAGTAPLAMAATLSWLRRLRNGPTASLAEAVREADRVLPGAADSTEALEASARFARGAHDRS